MLDPSAATAGVTHNLCNALAGAGCDVHLFTGPYWTRSVGSCTCEYRPHVAFYRRTQSRSYRADSSIAKLFWRAMRLFGHVATLAKLLVAARRFDVVHVQWLPVPAVDVVWLWLVARRTPVVYTVHNLLPHEARGSRAARALHGLIYRVPERLFTHTRSTARGLIDEFGVSPDRVVEIRHGSMAHLLELRRTRSAAESEPAGGAATDTPTVLFLGQIRRYKGLDTLLRAAARLPERVSDFRIRVAGRPRVDMAPYFDLVRTFGLEDVVDFQLGYIEEHELPRLLEQAAVVAFPYRSVDQSGVAVAACTFGKAIVATACGGLEEIVREADNGILVPVGEPQALADALAEILSDDALRRRFQMNSSRYAREALAWTGIAERTMTAYDSVIPPSRGSRRALVDEDRADEVAVGQ